jgi:Rrf2 family transcriptional regulator, cysteine metabolism repressor
MKVTYKGDYALKAVLDLSLYHGSALVTIGEMAKRINAPVKFLEQILLELKRGGFIESKRGKIGGYSLAKAPSQISVGDILRLIEGPTEPISCIKHGYAACEQVDKCVFRKIWQEVSESTAKIIDNVSFEDLASQVKSSQSSFVYSI